MDEFDRPFERGERPCKNQEQCRLCEPCGGTVDYRIRVQGLPKDVLAFGGLTVYVYCSSEQESITCLNRTKFSSVTSYTWYPPP